MAKLTEVAFAINSNYNNESAIVARYLQLSGLALNYADLVTDIIPLVIQHQIALQRFLAEHEVTNLRWQYQVPELGEGGACSIFSQLQTEPYDLKQILPVQSAPSLGLSTTLGSLTTAQALTKLQAITNFYQQQTGFDWFGIYQSRVNQQTEAVLVKLTYYGAASRPEFPLTADFAKYSNNSTVGLTGRAKIINHVADYVAAGGEYYTCDPKVSAEACLPLFDQSGKIVGIIDAEDFNNNVFTADAIALLVAICVTVPQYLP
jgi:L-methionine (R)-S-oxide reductase